MKLDDLQKKLFDFGNVETLKEGIVFTLLITGENLSHWNTISKIHDLVLDYVGDKYPNIEVAKNDKTFFLLILKPIINPLTHQP